MRKKKKKKKIKKVVLSNQYLKARFFNLAFILILKGMQLNIDFIFAAFKRFYNYQNNETINHIRLLVIKHLNAKKANNKKVVSKLLITLNEYCSIILNTDINISTFNNDIVSIILRFNRVQIY